MCYEEMKRQGTPRVAVLERAGSEGLWKEVMFEEGLGEEEWRRKPCKSQKEETY